MEAARPQSVVRPLGGPRCGDVRAALRNRVDETALDVRRDRSPRGAAGQAVLLHESALAGDRTAGRPVSPLDAGGQDAGQLPERGYRPRVVDLDIGFEFHDHGMYSCGTESLQGDTKRYESTRFEASRFFA